MKKIILFISVLSLTIFFTGCGKSREEKQREAALRYSTAVMSGNKKEADKAYKEMKKLMDKDTRKALEALEQK